MKYHNLRTVLAVIGLATAALGRPAEAGIAVSPLKQEISLRPGEAGKIIININNNNHEGNGTPQPVHIEMADVEVSPEGNLSFPPAGLRQDSASKWVTFSLSDVNMEPGKAQPVEFTITPPLFASPGEYYCAVIVTLGTKGRNEAGVAIQYRIASGIFVTVLGRTFPKQAKIVNAQFVWPEAAPPEGATTEPAATPSDEPLKINPKIVVMLQNTGKARFDATGRINVITSDSRAVYRTALTTGRNMVFAGDSRVFEANIAKALPAGKYIARVEMDYQSGWTTAHQDIPFEILPEQAQNMAIGNVRRHEDSPFVEVNPDKVAARLVAGATRSMALTLSNVAEDSIECRAAVSSADASAADSWVTLSSNDLSLPKSSRRAIELRIAIPPQTKPGKYATSVVLDAGPAGSTSKKLTLPIELEVKAEK